MIDLASALRAEIAEAARQMRILSDDDAARDRGAGKWVRKEILGHLVDSAANNHQRFVRAQLASPFASPGYDQQVWVSLHRYRGRPWSELVDLWVALNRHVAAVIQSVPADKLATPCTIGGGETQSLEWWMRDYLRHLQHHLAQIVGE